MQMNCDKNTLTRVRSQNRMTTLLPQNSYFQKYKDLTYSRHCFTKKDDKKTKIPKKQQKQKQQKRVTLHTINTIASRVTQNSRYKQDHSAKSRQTFPFVQNPQIAYHFFNSPERTTMSHSRFKKIVNDLQDTLPISHCQNQKQNGHKVVQRDQKRHNYALNMSKESHQLGIERKSSMRKPNSNRTRSAVILS